VFEGSANAGYADTTHGDRSSNVDATVNLPVIQDRLAVRATIYNEKRGGYINNVPGTFVRQSTDGGIAYAGYTNNIPGPPTPQNSANNLNLVGNAINPVTYTGIRAAALLQINDDWSALLTQSYQDMEADGVFYQTPNASGVPAVPLPDLSVQIYNPSYDKDRFENTALTITGRIAELKVVYAGGYLVRNIEQVQDYTAYARGVYADYYQCISPAQSSQAAQCYSPSSTWRDKERNTHNSQELRVSTPDDRRLRAIGGIFWESYNIFEDINWSYKTAPGFTDIAPPPGSQANDPNLRASNVAFLDDISRGYTQRAAFGSVDFDIIPNTLTLTAGTRYYHMNTTARGYSVGSFGCYEDGPPPCTGNIPLANDLTAQHLDKTYTGFRSRVNLSWKVTDDALLYYTWSQGFRPGGFNRGSSLHLNDTFLTPVSYAPDTLINNEIGWKSQWMDHRLQFNGAVYQEDWKDVQVTFFDPGELGNLNFTTNGPNYRVRGVETEISARVLHGLTLSATAAWNSSSLVNSPYLIGVDGRPILSIPNPYGSTGAPLADSPPFQGTLRARYEIQLGDHLAFCQAAATHQAHSYSATGNIVQFEQPPFSTYDASIGVSKGPWSLQLYGTNLTDTRAVLTANDNQFVPQQTVNRPRTIGLKYSYHQ
jgi:iron complex outermembrane receptor protein